MQHFDKIVLILQSVPAYTPNETYLKVATLQAQSASLSTLNNAANTSYAALKAARIDRNTFFYADTTGVLDLVKNAKAYIKSIYGATSSQYIAAKSIRLIKVISK